MIVVALKPFTFVNEHMHYASLSVILDCYTGLYIVLYSGVGNYSKGLEMGKEI